MTEILNQFRDEDLPPSTVDVGRAVLAGRQRRRTRLAAVGVAVALAAGGAAAPLLISARPGPVPPACGSPQPDRPSMPTWQRFDPLTSEIDTSGVAGYRVTSSVTSPSWQVVTLDRNDAGREEQAPALVMVMLFACGGEPRYFEGDQTVPFEPGAGDPSDPIGGTPGFWLPSNRLFPGGSISEGLAWQWTPGAWALVIVEPDPGAPAADTAALRAIAAQVAPQLRLGAGTPVTAPFSVPIPDGTYPLFTHTTIASDSGRSLPVGFSIGFNTIGRAEPSNPFGNYFEPSLAVTANPFATLEGRPANATEYPEDLGYPAYHAVDSGNRPVDALLVYGFHGFGMDIRPVDLPGASTLAERLSRAADIFRTVTVYPNAATDQSAWGDPIVP